MMLSSAEVFAMWPFTPFTEMCGRGCLSTADGKTSMSARLWMVHSGHWCIASFSSDRCLWATLVGVDMQNASDLSKSLYIRWQWCHLLLLSMVGAAVCSHVVGQHVVTDVSIVRSCRSICSLCSESSNTNLLLHLLIDVIRTSTLLPYNMAACTVLREHRYRI